MGPLRRRRMPNSPYVQEIKRLHFKFAYLTSLVGDNEVVVIELARQLVQLLLYCDLKLRSCVGFSYSQLQFGKRSLISSCNELSK